jgi:hypothetical protein
MCGCNSIPNPLPPPTPAPPYYPPVPLMRPQAGFDVLVQPTGGAEGRICSGWKIDPQNATKEHNYCCTPSVGRQGGRYQVAGCIKVSRNYDPFA